ncbi:hypothetical protein HYPSUDRAFT_291430 [Hypholoma sublateritium FD-334 SS-4]|uniref:Uncharacterized protein n=1 Tax=Hypholoma sublateritium (strain FD-334 SS-4) TaxID=945553 RepID=A0A0D2NIS8_HYPSF|nr:hypothetical protein HYPSUDRAFT_291430 [Hypholoma sublateritium FD-334 SS-4]
MQNVTCEACVRLSKTPADVSFSLCRQTGQGTPDLSRALSVKARRLLLKYLLDMQCGLRGLCAALNTAVPPITYSVLTHSSRGSRTTRPQPSVSRHPAAYKVARLLFPRLADHASSLHLSCDPHAVPLDNCSYLAHTPRTRKVGPKFPGERSQLLADAGSCQYLPGPVM